MLKNKRKMEFNYKAKIQESKKAINIINSIARLLKEHFEDNDITVEQLNKIHNLATDTESLKSLVCLL